MRNNKSGFGKVVFYLITIAAVCAGVFIYISPTFEKKVPTITFKDGIYWNLKDTLDLQLKDESGIKFYKVTYKDKDNEIVLFNKVLQNPEKILNLKIAPPALDMFFKGKVVKILVEAIDDSKWNFLEGNKSIKEFTVNIDKKRPQVNIISNSYAIRRGGSAIVIAQVNDENLKDAYISFSNQKRFELIPFYKEGYYIALIAWPVDVKEFTKVTLVASDKANNLVKTKIPLYIRKLKMKDSKINISSSFIKNVTVNVLETSSYNVPSSLEEIFVEGNNILRASNVKSIEDVSRKYMNKEMISKIELKAFKRLKNSATAAGFANRRHYYLDGQKIDEAWHLGMDWASYKRAPIKISNPGRVIFNDYLGIYGNTVIIDHILGLQTLYAHTSATNVNVGDYIQAGEQIANTGTTGAVLGDHLHFGVLVQGIEVNPLEWMDKTWMKSRIFDVIDEAKKVINNK